jgi:hypothetical protein
MPARRGIGMPLLPKNCYIEYSSIAFLLILAKKKTRFFNSNSNSKLEIAIPNFSD